MVKRESSIERAIRSAPTFKEKTKLARSFVERTTVSKGKIITRKGGRKKTTIITKDVPVQPDIVQPQDMQDVTQDTTISGQLEVDRDTIGPVRRTPDPGTVDVFRPGEFKPEKRFRREGTGIVEFAKETGRDIGIIAGGLLLGKDIKDLRDPFDVFTDIGAQKGEKVILTPQFGTISAEAPSGFREQTLFQLQAQAQRQAGVPEEVLGLTPEAQAAAIGGRVSKRVTSEFQKKVDIGELTVEVAQVKAQESFQKQFAEQTSLLQSLGEDLTERTGARAGRVAREVAITGGLVGASFISGPATFAAASVLGGTVAEAKGAERTRDILFGAGLVGGITAPGIIRQQVVSARVAALAEQDVAVLGLEARGAGKDSLTLLSGLRKTPVAKQTLELVIPTFETGATKTGITKFTVGGARGRVVTKVESFADIGKEFITTKEALAFTARGKGGFKSLISTKELEQQFGKDVTGTFGRLDLVRGGDKVTRSIFGGISKTDGDIISAIGGRGAKARIGFDQAGIPTGGKLSIKPESIGRIFKVKVEDIPADKTGFVSFAGRKGDGGVAGLGALKQLQTSGVGAQVGLKVAEIVKPIITRGGVALRTEQITAILGGTAVSQFAGTGQDIIQPSQESRRQVADKQFSLQAPAIKDIQATLPILDLITRHTSRGTQKPRDSTALDFITRQDVTQKQAPELKSATRQTTEFIQPSTPSLIFEPGFPRPFTPAVGAGFVPPIIPPVVFPTFTSRRRRGPRRPRIEESISPSLTGLAIFDIAGVTGESLELSGRGGRSPFDIRFVPEDLSGKREPGLGLGIFTLQPKRKKKKKK